MTASRQFKSLLAGAAAVVLMGTAMAQGNPPNPAIKSAPIGAGQQSRMPGDGKGVQQRRRFVISQLAGKIFQAVAGNQNNQVIVVHG